MIKLTDILNEAKKEEPKLGAFEEFAETREKGAEPTFLIMFLYAVY